MILMSLLDQQEQSQLSYARKMTVDLLDWQHLCTCVYLCVFNVCVRGLLCV